VAETKVFSLGRGCRNFVDFRNTFEIETDSSGSSSIVRASRIRLRGTELGSWTSSPMP